MTNEKGKRSRIGESGCDGGFAAARGTADVDYDRGHRHSQQKRDGGDKEGNGEIAPLFPANFATNDDFAADYALLSVPVALALAPQHDAPFLAERDPRADLPARAPIAVLLLRAVPPRRAQHPRRPLR